MKIKIVPSGFGCKLGECPPGLFLFGDCIGFKTKYGNNEVYVVSSGEVFWGGVSTEEERHNLIVIPCEYRKYHL